MPSNEETPALKILVVDDDPIVGGMIADFLSAQGYPPALCDDPYQAIEPFFLPFNSTEQESGLAISYRLLKEMGGLLSYSQGEKERIFTVSLSKRTSAPGDLGDLIMPQ